MGESGRTTRQQPARQALRLVWLRTQRALPLPNLALMQRTLSQMNPVQVNPQASRAQRAMRQRCPIAPPANLLTMRVRQSPTR